MRHAIGRVERVIVLAVIAAAMFTSPDAPRFHPDESHWIGLSAPFEAFFTGRFTDPIWETQQDKYLNAPMTYYVIGAARRLGGWSPDALNATWIYGRPYAENLASCRLCGLDVGLNSRRSLFDVLDPLLSPIIERYISRHGNAPFILRLLASADNGQLGD